MCLRTEIQRHVGNEEVRFLVGDFTGLRFPYDCIPARDPRLQHFLDSLFYLRSSRATAFGFLLDQQSDVRVFLEAVPGTVEVEVETLLLEFLQAGQCRCAVEVRADADGEQFGFGDAWRK